MALLTRLVPSSGEVLVPALAALAEDPTTHPSLRQVLASDPNLRDQLLDRMASDTAHPEVVVSLAGIEIAPGTAPSPRWQRLLVERLVESGNFRLAHEYWRKFANIESPSERAGIYDGRFQGLPGPPPFNWEFSQSGSGVAELAKGRSGLLVEYYGRQRAELARQLLLLPAGQYRVSFKVEGEPGQSESQLAWELSCQPGQSAIAKIPIEKVAYAGTRGEATFVIPTACPAQWMKLIGTPPEFGRPQYLTIDEVIIERMSRG